MKRTLLSTLTITLVVGMTISAKAQDVCEGLTGKALGICSAAKNSGCTDIYNESKACAKLADLYEDTFQEIPPWQPCPCFDSEDLNYWLVECIDPTSPPECFEVDAFPNGIVFNGAYCQLKRDCNGLAPIFKLAGNIGVYDMPDGMGCYFDPSSTDIDPITTEEYNACLELLLPYTLIP